MKRVILADAPSGAIVRVPDGRWGVVSVGPKSVDRRRWCLVDFWEGGRQRVYSWTVVEVQT